MTTLELPVSLGEALDKLTILDIKLARITDGRKANVQIEYDLLYSKLEVYISKYPLLYESLKKINNDIWDMMDDLRDGDISDELYLKVCKKTIIYNDIRFRIKNKINILNQSLIKEEKGYKVTKCAVNIDRYDHVAELINPIVTLSFKYDQVIVHSDDESKLSVIQSELGYDPSILVSNANSDMDCSPIVLNSQMTKHDLYVALDVVEFYE